VWLENIQYKNVNKHTDTVYATKQNYTGLCMLYYFNVNVGFLIAKIEHCKPAQKNNRIYKMAVLNCTE